LTSPLLEETIGAFSLFFSFSLFFNTFSLFFSFFYAPCLGVLMIFEEKITSSKISFQMKWYGHNYGYTGGGHIF
jgi:hypothetical protein